jgi:putative cofactor-binding repeat protein
MIVKPIEEKTENEEQNITSVMAWAKEASFSQPFTDGYLISPFVPDQGLLDNENSIKQIIDQIGTTKKACLVFPHYPGGGNTTTYTFSTNETTPSNVDLDIQNGAILSIDSGVTLTIYSPENIKAGKRQQIFSGSGTVAFTNGGTVYPEWWGANPTDATDDTSAFQKALTAAENGTLELQTGTYLTSTVLTMSGKEFKVQGRGPGVSEIRATDCNGFAISVSTYDQQVWLDGFTLSTTNSGTYKGITFSITESGSTVGRGLHVENVIIRGYVVNTDYWHTGIELTDGWYTEIMDTTIQGDGSAYNNASYGIVGKNSSIDVNITNCNIFYVQYGIYVEGDCEGWYIRESTLVLGDVGIYWLTTTGEPVLSVIGCHINAWLYGIYAENAMMSQIESNSIYVDRSKGNAHGIRMKSYSDHTIANNSIIVLNSGNNAYGILVEADYSSITGNTIDGSAAVNIGLWFASGADNNTAVGNIFQNCTSNVTNSGSGNQIGHYTGYELTASATWNPASVADGDATHKLVTVTGAALGDFAEAAFSVYPEGMVLDANIHQANEVLCTFANNTGGAIDLDEGTIYVRVLKHLIA